MRFSPAWSFVKVCNNVVTIFLPPEERLTASDKLHTHNFTPLEHSPFHGASGSRKATLISALSSIYENLLLPSTLGMVSLHCCHSPHPECRVPAARGWGPAGPPFPPGRAGAGRGAGGAEAAAEPWRSWAGAGAGTGTATGAVTGTGIGTGTAGRARGPAAMSGERRRPGRAPRPPFGPGPAAAAAGARLGVPGSAAERCRAGRSAAERWGFPRLRCAKPGPAFPQERGRGARLCGKNSAVSGVQGGDSAPLVRHRLPCWLQLGGPSTEMERVPSRAAKFIGGMERLP